MAQKSNLTLEEFEAKLRDVMDFIYDIYLPNDCYVQNMTGAPMYAAFCDYTWNLYMVGSDQNKKMANKTVSFEEIKKMIIECANVSAEITPESVLKTDLGFDSIYAVEMILELEEHFGIKIEITEMDTMMTVADVVKVVEKKLRG